MKYPIIPIPKPRQTRSDKWKQRPCVMRYRAFADEVRLRIKEDTTGALVVFYMPMPKSWSKKKRKEMDLKPHEQKPDLDNLLKALLDAQYGDDSHVWSIAAMKFWAEEGSIKITPDWAAERLWDYD